MKTKQRNQSEPDWLGTANDAELIRHRKRMRAILLLVSLFGVVVLAVVAWQLLTLEWTPQGINQRPRDSRFWRSEQAPREGRQSGAILGVMRPYLSCMSQLRTAEITPSTRAPVST